MVSFLQKSGAVI